MLDEVHFLQDAYRGPVWEEVIIHLDPPCAWSASRPPSPTPRSWPSGSPPCEGPTEAVIEERRPVELQNLYCVGDKSSQELHLLPTLVDGRPNAEADRLDDEALHVRHGGGSARGRPRRRFFTPRRLEVIERLQDEGMLPAITFIFSRKACDEARDACLDAGLRLTTPDERARVRAIVDERTANLADADLDVLGFDRFLAGLEAGVAAHHAGMVPPFKETVEACFIEGLTKAVFATETLALGVNMPARSVVIERLTKFTGERRELLTPGEYTQLTGRAGPPGDRRRRLRGGALVARSCPSSRWRPWPRAAPTPCARPSGPTYNMAANLVRRYQPEEAHHLLNLSFAQYQADRAVVRLEARIERQGERLARLKGEARCDHRDPTECPELHAHRRAGVQADRVGRELDDLRRQVRGRTESIARRFDRVLRLLEAWGYLDGWALTEAGQVLARTYHEADLLVAEAMTSGVLDDLDVPVAGRGRVLPHLRAPGPGPGPRAPVPVLHGARAGPPPRRHRRATSSPTRRRRACPRAGSPIPASCTWPTPGPPATAWRTCSRTSCSPAATSSAT